MIETKCPECVGSLELRCNAVRAIAKMAIDAGGGFTPEVQAENILRITDRASTSLLKYGCQLPQNDMLLQLTVDRS